MSTNPTDKSSNLNSVATEAIEGEVSLGASKSAVIATSNVVLTNAPTVSNDAVRWNVFLRETDPGVSFNA